jgi:hypothetical protein
MLGPQEVERYRRMTVAERLRETILLMEADEALLAALPPTERIRRLQLLEEDQERSNRALLRALAGR